MAGMRQHSLCLGTQCRIAVRSPRTHFAWSSCHFYSGSVHPPRFVHRSKSCVFFYHSSLQILSFFLISVIYFLKSTGLSPVFHKNSVILWFATAKQRRLEALKLPALRAVVARPDAEKRQGFLLLFFRRRQIGPIFGHPARSSIHGASPPSGQNTLR